MDSSSTRAMAWVMTSSVRDSSHSCSSAVVKFVHLRLPPLRLRVSLPPRARASDASCNVPCAVAPHTCRRDSNARNANMVADHRTMSSRGDTRRRLASYRRASYRCHRRHRTCHRHLRHLNVTPPLPSCSNVHASLAVDPHRPPSSWIFVHSHPHSCATSSSMRVPTMPTCVVPMPVSSHSHRCLSSLSSYDRHPSHRSHHRNQSSSHRDRRHCGYHRPHRHQPRHHRLNRSPCRLSDDEHPPQQRQLTYRMDSRMTATRMRQRMITAAADDSSHQQLGSLPMMRMKQ